MAVPFSLQATSVVVKSPPELIDHPTLEEPQKIINHHKPRGGQPQNRSREAHILAERTADLLVATSRLQTASKEAENPLLLPAFVADYQGKDV
jgi:hypothetical protein